jgi:CO dehydrogenase maturation factor
LSFTIAVSGKGGTGKTTLAGMMLRYLLEKGTGPILAVDADSNSNLNEVLGVEVRTTIGDAREMMKKDVPTGMTKDIWFDYKVQEALIENKGFDLIAMGRPEGPGCYCAANTLARKCLDLLTGNYRYIVIDNEAGMEHFSRLTTRDVDLLLIVSDSSRRSILTAARIRDLIHQLDLHIVREVLIVNRAQAELPADTLEEIQKQKLELGGTIPVDEAIYQFDLEGRPTFQLPLESKAVQAARRIFEAYIQ